jgi:hypothetical protein
MAATSLPPCAGAFALPAGTAIVAVGSAVPPAPKTARAVGGRVDGYAVGAWLGAAADVPNGPKGLGRADVAAVVGGVGDDGAAAADWAMPIPKPTVASSPPPRPAAM